MRDDAMRQPGPCARDRALEADIAALLATIPRANAAELAGHLEADVARVQQALIHMDDAGEVIMRCGWYRLSAAARQRGPGAWERLIADGRAAGLLHTGFDAAAVAGRAPAGVHYLATPYSLEVMRAGAWCSNASLQAGLAAADAAARLAAHGVTAISPIAQAALMVQVAGPGRLAPLDQAFWTRWCRPLLQVSGSVIVPDLPGWRRSAGILHEVTHALSANLPVYLEANAMEGS